MQTLIDPVETRPPETCLGVNPQPWTRGQACETLSLPSVVQVTSYLTKKFAELHSPNKFKVYMGHGGKPWVSDFNHPHYLAGRRALKTGGMQPWGRAGAVGPCAAWAMPPPTMGAEPLAEGLSSGLPGSGCVVGP